MMECVRQIRHKNEMYVSDKFKSEIRYVTKIKCVCTSCATKIKCGKFLRNMLEYVSEIHHKNNVCIRYSTKIMRNMQYLRQIHYKNQNVWVRNA